MLFYMSRIHKSNCSKPLTHTIIGDGFRFISCNLVDSFKEVPRKVR